MESADLYRQLAANMMVPDSGVVPRLLAIIADPQEAALLLALPGTVPELTGKLGQSPRAVQARLDGLFHKGLVFAGRRTDPPTWRMSRDVIQFHDASILWAEAPQEFLDLWQEFMETEWMQIAQMVSSLLPDPAMRIIPLNAAVENRQQILAFEDVEQAVQAAKRLAVVKCTCRLTAHKCDAPLEACLQLNRAADYTLERGTGREISREEAMRILRGAEEKGLIHTTMNKRSVDHVICNCCGCCCLSIPPIVKQGARLLAASRFRAQVDPEACTGCGSCLERCWFQALTLGENGVQVNQEKCLGCGVCTVVCPTQALALIEVKPPDSIPG